MKVQVNIIFFPTGFLRARGEQETSCEKLITVLSCVIGVGRGQRRRAKGKVIGYFAFSLSPPLLPLPSLLSLLLWATSLRLCEGFQSEAAIQ